MKKYFDEIYQSLGNENLNNYWEGFEAVAYALYDKNSVYLFNHPKMEKDPHQNYQILKRDDQFNGCTLILFHNYPTAIVDIELYKDYPGLYSVLVHELFHGFQYLKEEKRFANEFLGITYPLAKENIELRKQERDRLYKAVFEKRFGKKKQFLNTFIALRERRKNTIHDYVTYENLMETIEGPAWYVELKSYAEKSSQSYDSVLKDYGQHLIDPFASTSNIRRSCYSSGMFICLLLDEYSPNWKESFWEKEETIYDLLKEKADQFVQTSNIEISDETKEAIDVTLENRKKLFENFSNQKGHHVVIEGEIKTKFFDPINMVLFEDKILHKNFIKIEINDKDYLLQQAVVAYYKDDFQNVTKLHVIVKDKPVKNKDSFVLAGIGLIKGRYEERDKVLHLYVNDI